MQMDYGGKNLADEIFYILTVQKALKVFDFKIIVPTF